MRFQPATNTQHACSSLHHTRPRGSHAAPLLPRNPLHGRGRKVTGLRPSHTSQAENVGWSLSLQEWPLGQDPRCPGCVFHYSPHCYPRAPRAHARAHTPGYSSRRRVSPCGPPPLSTSVGVTVTSSSDGNVRRLRVRSRWVSGGRCAPGGLLRRVGEIPTTGLPLKAARPLGRWRRWRVLVCDPFPLGGFALVMSPETAAAVVACLLCVGFLFGEETEPRRRARSG